MGISPAHRFRQILGEVLERAVEPIAAAQAAKHSLYLDKRGARPCRKGARLSWVDVNGNTHDLDFVLERGGTDEVQGTPAAFIEVAWRRYTKHSRAKAQEIQGAIIPLLQQHNASAPFIGVVLAGIFTAPAVQQLRSLGFSVLYIPTSSIVRAFATQGIDAAADETTPDSQFEKRIKKYEALSAKRKRSLILALLDGHEQEVKAFSDSMEKVLSRQIKRILVLPLHGRIIEFGTVDDALASIEGYDDTITAPNFVRYEIQVIYDNGNNLQGTFVDKASAIEFLVAYRPVTPAIAITSGQ